MKEITFSIAVPREHPSYAGHFPDQAIVPGVLLLELIVVEMQAAMSMPIRLIEIPNTKFQRPVMPNETIDVQVRIEDEHASILQARFQVACGDAPVAAGRFVFAVDKDK
jgi:3-hydroxyacyl-[acyl-carrier-protein] dehydratase